MALFKIEKGTSDKLTQNRPYTNEGFCYFTTDDGKFYIDIEGNGSSSYPAASNGKRICLNAAHADTAGSATTASAVDHNFIITFATGQSSQEGTNKFTFNGSINKTINFLQGSGITLSTPSAGNITITNAGVTGITINNGAITHVGTVNIDTSSVTIRRWTSA